jgi:probable rRNA maturation factor
MPLRFEVRPSVRGALSMAELARLRTRAKRMLAAVALSDPSLGSPARVDAGLTLTDDQEIHELNRTWRKKDKPTDVLAFAMREGEGGALHPEVLGDVVISIETAKRQAKSIRKQTLLDEVVFLWSHGLCHLLGYDHRNDREEREMNARMAGLRAEAARRGKVRPA